METIDQDYQVLRALGQGLAGEVFLVQKGGQRLALKLLKQAIGGMSPEEAAAHFKAEFSILKQLSHPHIAKILDFGQDSASGRHYYTSEYVEGGDVFAGTRKIEPEGIEELFLQALRALEYLHSRRIPHFDLKPENLLLHQGKAVKLIDFGMAGFKPRGQLAGTPAFMAPEIVLGHRPDTRADLYSLGVTFYECATGANPFAAKGLAEMLRRQEKLIPPPARQANPKISEAFSETLEALMKKNPSERPATAGQALRLFAQLSGKKVLLETAETSLSYLPNETKLIGRRQAMADYQKLFDEVFRSGGEAKGRLLAISGPTGVGKSRLLKEIRFQSQLAGIRTLSPQEPEIPELGEPSCLIYDDLEPELIRKLALSLYHQRFPVLLVAAGEETIEGLEGAVVEKLEPFSREEIREYLSALTGFADPPSTLVEELERRSAGSPRFLTELLEELIRRGALFDEQGRWSADTLEDLGIDFSSAQASANLKEALAKELSKLDKPARELLDWIALSPEPVSAELLQAASSAEDLHYWMLELLNIGYLQRDEASQSYRIANPFLQSYLQKTLDPDRSASSHAAWALALANREGKIGERLYHLGRAGVGRESREALVELARRQEKKGDFQSAMQNLALAEDMAGDDVEAAIHIRLKIGEELIGLGKLNEALTHFDETRERLKKLSNSEINVRLKVSTLEHLGAAYIRANSLEKAKASFHSGLTLMEEFPGAEPQKKVIFENYLGRIQYQEGRLAEAEEIFRKSHELWGQLPDDQRRRVINNDLAEVLMALGKHEEARGHLLQQLEFFREIQNEPLQVKAFYNLAETEAALDHQDTSIDYFKRAIDLAKSQKNFDMLLRAYNGIGRIYHLRQDFENSRKYYDRALTIAQKLQDFQSQAGIETNLGIVLASLDRLSEATPHLKVAVRLAESLGKGLYEQYFLASAKLELGDVLRRQKDFEGAQGLVREAEAIAESQEALAPLLFPVKVTLARLHLDRDRRTEAEEIIQALKKRQLNSNEQIEITKLENMLAAGPGAGSREPAATAANFEYSRESQRSMLYNPLADSDYAKLLQLTRFINAETNLDFVLKSVLQYALELSGAERGLILLLDERDRLEVRASINTAVNANLTEISSKVAEQALQSGEIVESDDASQDGRFNEFQSVMILKLRSILCLPIHSRNKTVGVLYLDHRYRPGAFDKTRLPILQAFCDQAGLAIENAKLFEAYEKAQAQLKSRLEQAEAEAEHYHELLGEGAGKLPTRYAYENIVSKGKAMYEVFKLLDKITETNISVFINGETGTGKELIAKALHYNNKQRASARFVAINCGGIPPNLIESELFGYKAGAFTGASKDKKGLFAEADGGTIFLDEVAELELGLQVKLLRALQEGEIIPVGDSKPVKFDARVISASHKNLETLIEQGLFREDLFYRVCQIRIPLPPLRERKEDIPALAERFVANYAKEHGQKKAPKIGGGLLKRLLDYDWPGNIRELENTIRVACALAEGGELTPKALPEHFGKRQGPAPAAGAARAGAATSSPSTRHEGEAAAAARIDAHNAYDNRRTWEDYEKVIFAKAYAAADFKPAEASRSLDVSMATFYKRIKDFSLNEKNNPLFKDGFVLSQGKTLKDYLEAIFWAAYQASSEKAYTAIKWLDVSQGHFYNVLKRAKTKR